MAYYIKCEVSMHGNITGVTAEAARERLEMAVHEWMDRHFDDIEVTIVEHSGVEACEDK